MTCHFAEQKSQEKRNIALQMLKNVLAFDYMITVFIIDLKRGLPFLKN